VPGDVASGKGQEKTGDEAGDRPIRGVGGGVVASPECAGPSPPPLFFNPPPQLARRYAQALG